MDLEHSFTVDAPVDTVWSTMMDIEGVAECFPGATVTSVEDDSFSGTCKVKLGPIALVYKGSGSFVERDDSGHRAVIDAKGKDKRGNGTAGATVTMTMAAEGSGTRVQVVTDLNVTGKPAQFGRGVMQDVSDKLLGQFVDCLAGKFDAGGGSEEPATSPDASASPDGSAPTSAEGAADGGDAPVPSGSAQASGDASAAPAAAAMPASAVMAAGATPGAPAAASAPPPAASSETPGRASASSPSGTSAGSGSSSGGRRASGSDDALDLGAAVLPTVLRSYAPYAVVGLVAFVLGWAKGRRRRA